MKVKMGKRFLAYYIVKYLKIIILELVGLDTFYTASVCKY